MPPTMNYRIGDIVSVRGCLTRLIDIINRDPIHLEDLIGFHRGRLSRGYYLLLLKEPMAAGEFQFLGYTHLSGGKYGLPSNDPAAEAARPTVQGSLEQKFGVAGVNGLARKIAGDIPATGERRLAKIVPVIGHDQAMGPADQYPASKHGIAQFNLTVPKKFLVSAFVDPNRRFQGGGLDLVMDKGTAYDSRRAVFQYLSAA